MVKYRAIQPLVFGITPKTPHLKQKLWTLRVPEPWYSRVTALHQIARNSKLGKMRLPTRELTHAIHLVAPDIVFFDKRSWTAGNGQWLLSLEKIDCDAIRHITAAWVENNYGTGKAASEVIRQLKPDDLSWVSEETDFSSWSLEPNGTASPQDSYFRALPQFVCAVLTGDGVSMEGPWGKLRFIRVCHPAGDSEIVSWPPLQHGTWKYSYALSFTVQTIPFEGEPVLKCHASIRRWVSQKLTRDNGYHALSNDEDSTLYIRTEAPWLTGLPRPRGFSTARIRLVRQNGHVQPQYGGNIVQMLQRLGIEPRFPTATELCREPLSYIENRNGSSVAVVHSNRLTVNHRVTQGVPLPDRKCLFDRTAELLLPYGLSPAQTLNRVASPKSGPSLLTKPFKEVDKNCLRNRLAQSVGKDLLIELFHQPGTFSNIVRKTIEEELGLESCERNGDLHRYKTEDMSISVKERPLGALGAALTVAEALVGKNDRRKAITQRVQEIEKQIENVGRSTIAFVELADDSKDKPYDPKAAIRCGLARTGRLSQFMTPDDSVIDESDTKKRPSTSKSGLKARARSAVRDGLRQLGYLHGSPGEEAASALGLSQPLEIVGMWYLGASSRYLPLAIHIDRSGRIWLKHLGERCWLSYSDALLKLSRGQKNLVENNFQRQESQTFFKNTIEEIAAKHPVLAIASAENAGRHWKWITNKGVTRDKVQWQDGGALSTVNNLRIARVRAVEETPQWYAQENGALGVPAGLFTKSDRVYFGIQSTSVALQVTRAARCLSKVEKPRARVAIPRAQEIFLPVLQPGDDPQAVALFIHRMRRMAPQYDGPLRLPVPLHLASQVEEYVEAQISWAHW